MFDLSKPNNLIPIAKEEVATCWHVIRPGLKYMVDEGRNADGWTIDSVFYNLLNGKSSCVFTSIARPPKRKRKNGSTEPVLYKTREAAIEDSCGFSIVQTLEGANRKVFYIWIAVSNEATNKQQAPSILTTFREDMWALAKECGCSHISFSTNQDWWEKVGPRFGFEKTEVKWTAEIKE